jgi:hypothetical protein
MVLLAALAGSLIIGAIFGLYFRKLDDHQNKTIPHGWDRK